MRRPSDGVGAGPEPPRRGLPGTGHL